MTRFRTGLVLVVAAIAVLVVVTVIRPPMPPSASGTTAATLLPSDQRARAPDFTGIDAWINSSPLSLPTLRGHVVLVDFWTFSCVNCVRTLPHLRALYDAYRQRGFVIVGVHSPEFDFEKALGNVRAAVRRLGVTWPVAVDSEMATWNAYSNQYWPAEYLLDEQGRIAYVNLGEGQYEATNKAVASLIGVAAANGAAPTPVPNDTTPELYAGSGRGQLADGEAYGAPGEAVHYSDPGQPLQNDAIQVTGTWTDQVQYMQSVTSGHVRLRFHADTLYVVAGATGGARPVAVRLDGAPVTAGMAGPALHASSFEAGHQDLYELLLGVPSGYHLIDLTVPPGLQLYTFTFG